MYTSVRKTISFFTKYVLLDTGSVRRPVLLKLCKLEVATEMAESQGCKNFKRRVRSGVFEVSEAHK